MIGNIEQIIQYLFKQDKTKQYEVKEYKEKRSLNANNYAWKLITEIANVMKISKEEILHIANLADLNIEEQEIEKYELNLKFF